MGILHTLTLALRRLDPDNSRWEALQKETATERATAAFDTHNKEDRDAELADISATFERYKGSDFGRKLYLIQNSIFGVDIQPVALQIAKLRFFISLAIEQQPNGNANDNYGIKPLPNLETRFVAANTLRCLEKPEAGPQIDIELGKPVFADLEQKLIANRERYFHANNRQQKMACRKQDGSLRRRLAEVLEKNAGYPAAAAGQVANWNPFEQNAHADWFDAEYMFGVTNGFDVVIGNPPYRQVKKGTYSKEQFPFSEGKDKGKQNLYKLFVEQAYNLLRNNTGVATLIVQSSLMCDLSSTFTRKLLLNHTKLHHVIEFPKAAATKAAQVFQNVTQGTCVYQITKRQPASDPINISVDNDIESIDNLHFTPITRTMIEKLYPSLCCFPRIKENSVSILEKVARSKNIKPLSDYISSIRKGDLNLGTHSSYFSNKVTEVLLLRGRHFGRYVVRYNDSNEYCENDFMQDKVKENRNSIFLISQTISGTNDVRRLHFTITDNPSLDFLCGDSIYKTRLCNQQADSKIFLALLNSHFMDWYFRITSSNNNVQGYELEQLPIPSISAVNRRHLTHLADRILAAKAVNPSADTSKDEAEIDRLVYQLYNLTDEEIAVVEGSSSSSGGQGP